MEEKHQKSKLKKFLLFLVILATLLVIITIIIFRAKTKPVVNDYTVVATGKTSEKDKKSKEEAKTDNKEIGEEDKTSAKLSSLVKVIDGDNANKVNAAITDIKNTALGITLTINSVGKDIFSSYGKGDIFILDGNKDTPFGGVRVGKITSIYTKSDGNIVVNIEEPAIDEIFDELYIDKMAMLTEENLNSIETMPGVSYEKVQDISSINQTTNNEQNYNIDNMTPLKFDDSETSLDKLKNINLDETLDLIFKLNMGLEYDFATKKFKEIASTEIASELSTALDVGNLSLEAKEGKSEKEDYSNNEGSNENKTDTNKNQDSVKKDDIDSVKKLMNALGGEISDNKESKTKASIISTGQIGIEDVGAKVHLDLNVLRGGLTDFSCGLSGNVIAKIETQGLFNFAFGAETSEFDAELLGLKFEGLDKKLIPLFYVDFLAGVIPLPEINSTIEDMPFSVGIMAYMDLSGNLTIGAKASLEYNYKFNGTVDLIKNGSWVNASDRFNFTTTQSGRVYVETAARASARFDIGAAALINVAGVCIVDIDIFDVYLKFEGMVGGSLESVLETVSNLTDNTNGESWNSRAKFEYSASLRFICRFDECKNEIKINT